MHIKLYALSHNDFLIPLLTIPAGFISFLGFVIFIIFAPFPDLMFALLFIPFVALGIAGIYYLRKNRSYLVLDSNNNQLTWVEGGKEVVSCVLSDIEHFVLKKSISNIGSYKYGIQVILNDQSIKYLFEVDQFLLPFRFINRLSKSINKPFIKEVWVEDYDGNVSLVSDVKIQSGSKQTRVLLGGTLLIPLLGSIVYAVILNKTNFLFVGVATWFVFILFILFYSNKYFKEQPEIFKNKFIAVIAVLLSLNTTPIFLYLLSCFILSGFKMPFW